MKKTVLLLSLCLSALLVSCGGGDAPVEPDNTVNTEAPAAAQTYTFQVESADNFEVAIDMDMADVLAALGESDKYFEAASCAFNGLDKTYTYSGFEIVTRPEEADLVNSIRLTDDSVTTPEGVYIGSTVDEVKAAYGEAEAADGVITYTKGNTTLQFILTGDSVLSIEYLPA